MRHTFVPRESDTIRDVAARMVVRDWSPREIVSVEFDGIVLTAKRGACIADVEHAYARAKAEREAK